MHVAYRLVHHLLRLLHSAHRQTPYTYVHAPVGVALALAIVKKTEIVIGRVCLGLYGRVLRLVSKKCVLTAIAAQFAVIVGAVAHKQKPTRFLNTAVFVSTVIEHLHHPTISGGIGSSRRELVVGLLVGYNRPCYPVYLLMRLRQLGSLGNKLLRANNHVVDILKRMHILIVDATHHVGEQPVTAVGVHCDIFLNTRLIIPHKGER